MQLPRFFRWVFLAVGFPSFLFTQAPQGCMNDIFEQDDRPPSSGGNPV